MQKIYSLLLLVLVTCFANAQNKVSVHGTIVDSASKQPLSDATVSLILQTDSSQSAFSIADAKGHFSLKNIPASKYILQVTFTGYRIFDTTLRLTVDKPVIEMGTISMTKQSDMLQEVIVQRPPIIIKKDTVEFNASAFKTKPNATVEDLLKKLPGVEVDKDGNVTNQGEQITKVYVDGKEFFSNDPKLATKNLTADMVESVQVFDDMSDQAKFTKIDDGSKQKTINIKLKKDKKKGYFGRANVGAGTSDRYNGSLLFNDFKQNTQMSVLGGANNVNVSGFTSSDMFNTGGGGGGGSKGGGGGNRGGGGNGGGNSGTADGNTTVWDAGFNYRDKWSPKMDVSGNYFVSNSETVNNSYTYRQNLYTDSSSNSNTISSSNNKQLNNRINFRWEYAMDSMNSVLAIPTFSTQHSTNYSESGQKTESTKPYDYLAVLADRQTTGTRDGWNFGNNLLFRHRFKKVGRTLTIGWNTSYSANDGTGYVLSDQARFTPDSVRYYHNNQNQQNNQTGDSKNNTVSTSFTEGIGTNKILEFNYAYTNNQNTSDKKTFDYDSTFDKFVLPNIGLTNHFDNTQITHRAGTNFRVKLEKYDFQLGGAINFSTIKNESIRLDSTRTPYTTYTNQNFVNFFPTANFNYYIGTRKSIRFNYHGNTQAPTITQLQNVIDSSNQLQLQSGNPYLKQQFTQNFGLSYKSFNPNNFMFLSMDLNFSTISNMIVNQIITLDKAQMIIPVNTNGSYNSSLYVTTGIPLVKVASGKKSPLNLNLTTSARFNRGVSILDSIKNFSNSWVLNERFNFNLNVKEKLDLGASANVTYNTTTYTVNKTQDIKYFSYHYSLDATYSFFKTYMLSSDFDFFVNTGRSSGFNQNVPLWNASVAKRLFKKQNGEVRFSVLDILNQNKSITTTTGDNWVQDTRTQVLQRFFMVSFMYNLGKFGGRTGTFNGRGGGGGGGGFRGGGRMRD
jgi:uncharacterized membrane protein YgcG